MTDDEWLYLIEHTPPEDLTLGQIEQLRHRLAESSELRAAFSARLEMEQYLAAALGRVEVSIDEIVARVGGRGALGGTVTLPVFGWAMCLVLVGFIGLVLLLAVTSQDASKADRQAADRAGAAEESSPAAEELSEEQSSDETTAAAATAAGAAEPSAAAAKQPAGAPAPAAAAAAAPAVSKHPWDDVAGAVRPRIAAAALFAEIDPAVAAPSDELIKQWFGEAAGLPHQLSRKDYFGNACGVLDGVWRLEAPLGPKTALRLSVAEYHNLKIHFWHGGEGLTLHYLENANQAWVAYRTTRPAAGARPATWGMAATDEDRYWRTNPVQPVTFEIRQQDGVLTLSRGDVRVLSAPLPGPADEIYFDGHVVLRQIALVPAAELQPEPELPPAAEISRPAELAWSGQLAAGADFQKLPDGRVQLVAEKNPAPAWVAVALPDRESLSEVVVRLDDPQPGTGFFLGDDQGPRYPVGFYREAKLGQTSCFPAPLGDVRIASNHDVDNAISPLTPPGPWFRLVFGCGTLKCSLSADGVHWGRPFDPLVNQLVPYSHFGLYAVAGEARKSVTLARIELRELAALDSLAPAELRRKAPARPLAADTTEWLSGVFDAQPAGVDSAQWRRACALRTLAAGTTFALGTPLVDALLDDALAEPRPVAEQLELVREAALLYHTWDDPAAALRASQLYERIGRRAHQAGQTRPCSLIAHAQRTAPIWSRHVYNFLPDELVRMELIELAEAGRWSDVRQFCSEQRFWRRLPPNQPSPAGLVDWADALAARQLPQQANRGGPSLPADWRHPLLVELSKEGYNVLAEFRAALDGRAYRDACQIISTAADNGLLGLLPDEHDPNLLVSLPAAVALAMRDHPDLESTMADQFGALGRLRIRQAIAENNVAAVEAGTTQFFGTPGAAEAHLWLADRALSSGAFAHALGQYRRAQRTAAADLRPRIAAAQQLAAASMGLSAGDSVTRSVTFGETQLTPAALKALVVDLAEHRQADNLSSRGSALPPVMQPAPPPTGYDAALRFRLEGDVGDAPQAVPAEMGQYNVDWVAHQIGLAVDGNRLVVDNRFQLSAYDLAAGKLLWRSELAGDHGPAHDWPLMPMRPLLTASRIFARRLHRAGPALACFDAADGKVIWTSKIEPEKWVVGDPLLIQDELFALVMTRLETEFTLSLSTFDPQSGAVLRSSPLIQLHEPWWQERNCQVAAAGDALLVACGGTVLSCDLFGEVRWVRRQLWLPPSLDRSWLAQSQDPPLVVDGRLFVVEPGVHSVAALETESGRLVWRQVMPRVRRIVGHAENQLLVETDAGFTSLEAGSGKPLWHHDVNPRLDAVLLGGAGGLLYARPEPVAGENAWRPVLVWVDLATGSTQAEAPLESLKHDRPKLGPLWAAGERRFAFFGRGDADATRDVVELVPQGPTAAPKPAPGLDVWNRQTDPVLRAAAGRAFPHWTLLGGRSDPQTGIQAQLLEEKSVLSTLTATPARPLELVRRVAVPADGNPKLRLRVANDPQGKWKLEVRAAGQTLLDQTIDQAFTGGAWKDLEVDLKPLAGQRLWLIVRQTDLGGPQPYAKWKQLELVP